MARITVEIEDSKAALLRERAKRFGLLPWEFVNAYIEDLCAQPEPQFEDAISLRNIIPISSYSTKRVISNPPVLRTASYDEAILQ
jgi:hypothetical protein